MIRLDLSKTTPAIPEVGGTIKPNQLTSQESLVSYHLQSDYANMKRIQTKLQEALDEQESVHSQRIMKYIS
jgi:hypothetical protein